MVRLLLRSRRRQAFHARRVKSAAERFIYTMDRLQEASALRCWYHSHYVKLNNGEGIGNLLAPYPCRTVVAAQWRVKLKKLLSICCRNCVWQCWKTVLQINIGGKHVGGHGGLALPDHAGELDKFLAL